MGQGGGGAGQGGTAGTGGQGGTGGSPPVPDGTCAAPFIIGPNQTVSGDTTGIVGVFDNATCGSSGTGNQGEAVYQITATATGILSVTLNPDANDFDGVLYARTTCGDTATELDCDDKTGSANEVISFNVVAGETIYVIVDGWNDTPAPNGDAGPFVLTTETFVCGDGVVAPIEPCDDGNGIAGDGCSATCAVEPGYQCSGQPSTCTPLPAASCADPIVVSDGFNFVATDITAFGDGYSTFPIASCTNDGAGRAELVFRADLLLGETVMVSDFGGADLRLRILDGGMCGGATTCAVSIDGPENTPGPTYTASVAGPVYIVVESFSTTPVAKDIDLDFAIYPCGDGIIETGEVCDDGDGVGGDGCSATCKIEPGYTCSGAPSVCTNVPPANCADPIDVIDGSTFASTDITAFGDDLSLSAATCTDGVGRAELVFSTPLAAGQVLKVNDYGSADVRFKVLTGGVCANGSTCTANVDTFEETTGLYYVATVAETVSLVVETNSTNPGPTVRAIDLRFYVGTCGNAVTELAEGCDDGNSTAGDGCSPTCTVEAGFACSGSPSVCAAPTASTCASPITVTDGYRLVGNTLSGFGDELNGSPTASCLTDGANRPEIVFAVPMTAGQVLSAKDVGTMDVNFKLLGPTCGSGLACTAVFDGLNGEEFVAGFNYTATASETVYLVLESWFMAPAATQTYDLRFDLTP